MSLVNDGSGAVHLFRPGQAAGRKIELHGCTPVDSLVRSDRLYVVCSNSGPAAIDTSSGEARGLGLGIVARSATVAGDQLIVGDYSGRILRVSGDMGTASPIIAGCLQGAERLAAAPDGRYVYNSGLSASYLSCLARAQVPADEAEGVRNVIVVGGGLPAEARGVAVSPDSKLVAYGFADGTVIIYDAETLNPTSVHQGLGSEVRGLNFNADAQSLSVATRDGRIASLDVADDYLPADDKRKLLRTRVDRAVEMGFYRQIFEFRDLAADSKGK